MDALGPELTSHPPLVEHLRALDRVVVAFSGGVDSALLAHVALEVLGHDRVLAVTAVSPSLADGELEHCSTLATSWGLRHAAVETTEIDNPSYTANAGDRCYWCKDALMDAVTPMADAEGATVVLGVNIDDLADHRPGQAAARERGARFPLVDAAMTKRDIRRLARARGLPVWDRPARPCLASRIPYGTAVTVDLLGRVDRAEAAIAALGFSDFRVRHHGDTARIEVPEVEIPDLAAQAASVVDALTALGYRYVTLDLAGLRSGNLNAALHQVS